MFVYTRSKSNDTCVVSIPVLAVVRLTAAAADDSPSNGRVAVPGDIPVYLKFGQQGPFSSEDGEYGEGDKVFVTESRINLLHNL